MPSETRPGLSAGAATLRVESGTEAKSGADGEGTQASDAGAAGNTACNAEGAKVSKVAEKSRGDLRLLREGINACDSLSGTSRHTRTVPASRNPCRYFQSLRYSFNDGNTLMAEA